jgi:hypothetical protein
MTTGKLRISILVLGAMACLLGAGVARAQAPLWSVTRPAAEYDRGKWMVPGAEAKVKAAGNLGGWMKQGDWFGLTGWVEYDVDVPQAGWYELLVTPSSGGIEYTIDGKDYTYDDGGGDHGGHDGKVGNFWLAEGQHTVHVQRLIWTGFNPVSAITLSQCPPQLAKSVRIVMRNQSTILRQGEKLEMRLYGGGPDVSGTLTARVENTATHAVQTFPVNLPEGPEPTLVTLPIPCAEEGFFRLTWLIGDQALDTRDARALDYQVIDTTPVPHAGGDVTKSLIQEIDCVATEPDYVMGGDTTIVHKDFGDYRESGDIGYLEGEGNIPREDPRTSFFAYKVTVPEAEKPYILEYDYPDDQYRTFLAVIREAATDTYPIASGPDAGGEYPVTNTMLTHTILFWPHTTDLRVVFLVPQTGRRAAVSKLRVYQVQGDLPLLKTPPSGGRSFGNWYEEGSNFEAVYGAPDRGPQGITVAADRWARSIAYMGGDLLAPTVSVYQMLLYPGNYHTSFGGPFSYDTVRVILDKCEKYGEKFFADFHPECRELAWPYLDTPGPAPNIPISKDGKPAEGVMQPKYNPLFPQVQKWYLGMIGEFADRYKDSPALEGISLRLMTWDNPGLNNFHSLDWGYDDYTIGLFEKDTGLQIPGAADDPGRYKARYDWLMANAKEQWINWRCDKIVELYTKIRDRVRQARPDLKVYLPLFGGFPDDLRDAGLDVQKLNAIDGVCVIDALYGYGRRQMGGRLEELQMRDNLVNPVNLDWARSAQPTTGYLFGAGYFEATETVAEAKDMGFPPDAKWGWISGVCNPAGRNYLERWVLPLAQDDANLLMDGGNAYTLGQPELQEFLSEYRALPPAHFTPREDARDPVAVWELKMPQGLLFYAVNREPYGAKMTMQLGGSGKITRLATGEAVPPEGGVLSFDLLPYQLLTFKATGTLSLTRVGTEPSAEGLALVGGMVQWLEQLAGQAQQGQLNPAPNADQVAALGKAAQEARVDFDAGHTWAARTLIESSRLFVIYQAVKQYPPSGG